MKLGFILEPAAPNSTYRVIIPMRAMERLGHQVLWPSKPSEDTPLRDLFSCDLVHCFRRLDRIQDLRELSRRGVALSFDNDDDLAATDLSSVDGGRAISGVKGHLDNMRKFADIIRLTRLADLTTTPSHRLAEMYRKEGANHVTVLENHLERNMFGFGLKSKRKNVVIGWIAGRDHEADLPHVGITEALVRLLEAHADLEVMSIGVRLPLRSDRYTYSEWIEFKRLLVATGGIDIGIAPLANTRFNQSRSNVKLKEYSSGGAAWLASPVGAYQGMGAKQGGLLVENDAWFDALDQLIRSGFKRKRLSSQALKWAKSQTIDHFASVWEKEFVLAVERARERGGSTHH